MFDETILGHDEIRSRLFSRLNAGTLSGAMLFVGAEGVGKRRVAMELAQREICFRRSACGICEGCLIFKSEPLPKEFPNMLRIAPEGKAGIIKVNAIREDDLVEGGIIHWAYQAPAPNCHKWILIEDAHRLGKIGANILLKTLEEPPPGTFFILVSHTPASVLPTIQSRAERIAFGTLEPEVIGKIAVANGWKTSELDSWTAISNGTLKYLDRDLFDRASSQIEAWVSIMEGTPFVGVSEKLLPKSGDVAQSKQLAMAMEQLLIVLDDLSRLQAGKPSRLADWRERIDSIAKTQRNIKTSYKYTLDAMRALNRNVTPEAILRKISLSLC
ncbi:MAG: hypothetical protein FWG02_02210 [Holophagaceae bacterium]|nr:hypothetical protein [Holophagaceae bacterium]